MTRFTNFSNEELKDMESAFSSEGVTHLVEEVRAEKKCREKEGEKYKKVNWHDKIERLAANSNYGMATRSCDDDEKLVVLCMINKQLKNMQETLARIDDKV